MAFLSWTVFWTVGFGLWPSWRQHFWPCYNSPRWSQLGEIDAGLEDGRHHEHPDVSQERDVQAQSSFLVDIWGCYHFNLFRKGYFLCSYPLKWDNMGCNQSFKIPSSTHCAPSWYQGSISKIKAPTPRPRHDRCSRAKTGQWVENKLFLKGVG